MAKITKTIRLSPTLIREVAEIAKKEHRNFNNMVEVILTDRVKSEIK